MAIEDYTDKPRFGCPECESDRAVVEYNVELLIQAYQINGWTDDGEPIRGGRHDDPVGMDPEKFGVDLEREDLEPAPGHFHCFRCGIDFNEPVQLDSPEQDRDGRTR